MAGVDPIQMDMTYGQLVDAANAKRIETWDHTAHILCLMHNANRAPGTTPSLPDDWHPYRRRRRRKSKYTGAVVTNIHNELKAERPVCVLSPSKMKVIEE